MDHLLLVSYLHVKSKMYYEKFAFHHIFFTRNIITHNEPRGSLKHIMATRRYLNRIDDDANPKCRILYEIPFFSRTSLTALTLSWGVTLCVRPTAPTTLLEGRARRCKEVLVCYVVSLLAFPQQKGLPLREAMIRFRV